MANIIHQHPDGHTIVRFGDKVYMDTSENFKKDFGVNISKTHDERLYEQGKRHALYKDNSVVDGGPLPWPQGDKVFDDIDDALAKQQQRENKKINDEKKRVRDEEKQNEDKARAHAKGLHDEAEEKVRKDKEDNKRKWDEQEAEFIRVDKIQKAKEKADIERAKREAPPLMKLVVDNDSPPPEG